MTIFSDSGVICSGHLWLKKVIGSLGYNTISKIREVTGSTAAIKSLEKHPYVAGLRSTGGLLVATQPLGKVLLSNWTMSPEGG